MHVETCTCAARMCYEMDDDCIHSNPVPSSALL